METHVRRDLTFHSEPHPKMSFLFVSISFTTYFTATQKDPHVDLVCILTLEYRRTQSSPTGT